MRDPNYRPLALAEPARRGAAAARRRDGRAGHHARREGVHRRDPDAHLHVPARVVHRRPRGRLDALDARAGRPTTDADRVDAGAAPVGARATTASTTNASAPRSRGAQPPAHARRRRPTTGATWRVQQVLVDPELHNDWMAEFEVDLAASREANQPVMHLVSLGAIG